MHVALLGVGSDTLLAEFDAAGIHYVRRFPLPPTETLGQIMIMNATGLWLEIVNTITPIAAVLVAWLQARASRKIFITLENNKVIYAEGMSAKEVEHLLSTAKSIMVLETDKPDEPDK